MYLNVETESGLVCDRSDKRQDFEHNFLVPDRSTREHASKIEQPHF
jgi:hypothetical protein